MAAPVRKPRLFEDEYHARVAIPSLGRVFGYTECFCDHTEKHKSSFDSLGDLNGKPCFIEVKLRVSAAEVRHIEAKLNEGFRRLGNEADRSVFAEALRKVCPAGVTPLFGVIALSYGEKALVDLVEILRCKAKKLQFAWVVWRCTTDGSLSEIAADRSCLGVKREGAILPEHIVPVRSARKSIPSKQSHADIVSAAGAGILFDQAVSIVERNGGHLKSKERYLSGKVLGAHIRLYSQGSSAKKGLLLGIEKGCSDVLHASRLSIVGYGDFGHPEFRVQNGAELSSFLNELAKFKGADLHQAVS